MFCFRLALALALAAVLAAPAVAQPLTLEAALERARAVNGDVRLARLATAEAAAAVTEMRARYQPSVSVYSSGGQRYGLGFDETAGELTQTTTESLSAGLQGEWTVFDGHRRSTALERARADLAAGESDAERVAQARSSDVVSRYFEALSHQAAMAIAVEDTLAQREQLRLVMAQIRVGTRPETDRYLQEERVAAAALRVVESETATRVATVRIARLLALPATTELVLVAPVDDSARVRVDSETLVREALAARPDIAAQQAAIRAARSDRRAARGTRLPTLSLVGRYGTDLTTGVPGNAAVQVSRNRGGSLGLQLTLPLLDRGTTRARTAAAAARLRYAELQLAELEADVISSIKETLLDIASREEQVAAAERRAVAAAAALDAETTRYRLGAGTVSSLAEARSRHVDASLGVVRATLALGAARALLDFRAGRL